MGVVSEPRIYSCDEWGARPPLHAFAATTPTSVVWHHMATPNRPLISDPQAALQKAYEIARQCQADHMDGNGWADTGQHFTITRDGIILEGRHGSLAAARAGHCIRGAHAADAATGADANSDFGIEAEGTYTSEPVPQALWNALIHLTAWLCQQTRLDSATLRGHRDTGCRTACPGDWLERQLPRARHEVHNLKLNGTKP